MMERKEITCGMGATASIICTFVAYTEQNYAWTFILFTTTLLYLIIGYGDDEE